MQKITYPTKSLAQGCEYRLSYLTDIKRTWRKFGWSPISELTKKESPKFFNSWGRETSEKGALNA
jgi:hypothetical protein